MWWILLDVLVVAIVAFYIRSCAKKGFAKSAMEVAALIIAYFLASTFSGIIAGWTYDNYVEANTVKKIEDKLMAEADATLSSTLPDYAVSGAHSLGIYDDILESQRGTARETAQALGERVVKPVYTSIARMVFAILIFVVLMFIFRFLIKLLNKAFKLPVIDGLNTFLGGLFGILKGGMVMLFVCFGISVLMMLFEGSFLFFNADNIEKSYLFDYIYNINPFI